MDRVTNLKQALPYIQRHRGKTFVIKLGGRVLQDRGALLALAEDMTLLHNVGIHVVVVHGGGPQMNALASRLGIDQEVVGGRRVTNDDTLDMAKMLFRGRLNLDLVSALREFDTLAVGLSGGDGGLVEAVRRPEVDVKDDDGTMRRVDFGHVGDVVQVHPAILETLTAAGYIPVVCSLASTLKGGVLNVNADTIAERIAIALGADKLFFLTDAPGLMESVDDPSSLISYCDAAQLHALLESGKVAGGMRPKLAAAIRALSAGVQRVHIVSAWQPSAMLLEVFTNEGCGTLVVRDTPKETEA
ncbi:MAG: acetylglutamate kinase [Myxococcota bacterium]